jgi:hypothetical protein
VSFTYVGFAGFPLFFRRFSVDLSAAIMDSCCAKILNVEMSDDLSAQGLLFFHKW